MPWEATASAAEADGGGGAAPLRADDVYRPREHQRPVFDGQGLTDRKAVYTRDEAVAVLERHAEQHAGPSASKALTLDPMLAGQTVGEKNIVRLPSGLSNASAVRFKCTRAIQANDKAFGATLATLSLHRLVQPPAVPAKLRSYRSKTINAMHTTKP